MEITYVVEQHERTVRLDDRDLEILRLIRRGFAQHEVADQIGMPARTVKFRVARMREAFGCQRTRRLPDAFEKQTGGKL
jgi:DNA-binding NarL/FixJ family response regulator